MLAGAYVAILHQLYHTQTPAPYTKYVLQRIRESRGMTTGPGPTASLNRKL